MAESATPHERISQALDVGIVLVTNSQRRRIGRRTAGLGELAAGIRATGGYGNRDGRNDRCAAGDGPHIVQDTYARRKIIPIFVRSPGCDFLIRWRAGGAVISALLTLALALPPTGEASQLSLDLSANFTYFSLSWPVSTGALAGDGRAVEGGGSFAATFYLGRPVIDDDAPLSLQPFLQRASVVTLALAGSGFSLTSPGFDRTGSSGLVSADVAGYVTRRLYLGADVGLEFDRAQDTPTGESQ